MRQLHAVVAAAIAVLAATAAPARAEKVGIVLESYVGDRNAQAEGALREILAAFADRGYDYGTEVVGRVFEARVSRPAITTGLPKDFVAQVERGHRAYISGQFEDAVQTLAPLVEATHTNPGAFADDQSLRTAVAKALVALALAHGRVGDAAAQDEAFAEFVRTFPNATPDRAFGNDALAAFDKVRKQLAARPGKLSISATDPAAVVFVNEAIQRVQPVTLPTVSGEYRVFVQAGRTLSRVHIVNVGPGQDVGLEIDLGFDAAIHTGPTWTGLTFATAADREQNENLYAADFARAIGAKAVAVVGIDASAGRAVAFGTLVNRAGRDIRRASVTLEPAPTPDRLRGIATFLVDNKQTPGVEVQTGDAAAPSVAAPRIGGGPVRDGGSRDARWGGWKWMTGAVGVIGLGVGGVLVAIDNTCSSEAPPGLRCPTKYEHTAAAWSTLAGGAVIAGITVYLFATSDAERATAPHRTAYIVPTGDGVAAGFTTRW